MGSTPPSAGVTPAPSEKREMLRTTFRSQVLSKPAPSFFYEPLYQGRSPASLFPITGRRGHPCPGRSGTHGGFHYNQVPHGCIDSASRPPPNRDFRFHPQSVSIPRRM